MKTKSCEDCSLQACDLEHVSERDCYLCDICLDDYRFNMRAATYDAMQYSFARAQINQQF